MCHQSLPAFQAVPKQQSASIRVFTKACYHTGDLCVSSIHQALCRASIFSNWAIPWTTPPKFQLLHPKTKGAVGSKRLSALQFRVFTTGMTSSLFFLFFYDFLFESLSISPSRDSFLEPFSPDLLPCAGPVNNPTAWRPSSHLSL